ncbi:MAG: LysR family transcriptional regulator [Ramlibacter sp.]|nr:LysR family transcriptional regulator [Ramlibacter sp.]
MRRHIPSTRALLVFDAVARHHGVGKAAEELCITHSAVSQQLRQLESQLGLQLVRRGARGSTLTEVGRRYHAQVVGDLLRLQNHTLEAMAQRPDGMRLLVGCVPVFAERWLLPRLPAFLAMNKGFSLHLQVYPTQSYMAEVPFDVAVQYDDAAWPGVTPSPLMPEVCVAVCAPQSLYRRAMQRGDFRAVPLLQLSSRLGAWDEWLSRAGIARTPGHPLGGHRFDLFSMLVEAVRADLGIGLVPHYFVERELRSGELALAHPFQDSGARGYSLFVAPGRLEEPVVQSFARWLRTTVAAEGAAAAPSDAGADPSALQT